MLRFPLWATLGCRHSDYHLRLAIEDFVGGVRGGGILEPSA